MQHECQLRTFHLIQDSVLDALKVESGIFFAFDQSVHLIDIRSLSSECVHWTISKSRTFLPNPLASVG
jgi:hypothetical protein